MKRKITSKHFQEKRREMQDRSAKFVYLHLSRSALNFAAFPAQIFFELNLLLYTPFCFSFRRCFFSPGLRGRFSRNFDQTFWFSRASCSRVITRIIFMFFILSSVRLRHLVFLNSFMNKRSVAYSCASTEHAALKKNKNIPAVLKEERINFRIFIIIFLHSIILLAIKSFLSLEILSSFSTILPMY